MNDKQRREFERGRRTSAHVISNTEDFPSDGKAAELAARVAAELATLSTLDVAKATSLSKRQQGSTGRRDVRESLRAQVKAMRETAKVIGLDHPEVKGSFERSSTDNSDRTLIADARAAVQTAPPLKALFIEYGLEADFIEKMTENAASLERYMSLQAEGVGARVNATASINQTLKSVDELIAKLDVIVRNKHRNDPAKLAAWESAHHLERAARTKRSGEMPPTPKTS